MEKNEKKPYKISKKTQPHLTTSGNAGKHETKSIPEYSFADLNPTGSSFPSKKQSKENEIMGSFPFYSNSSSYSHGERAIQGDCPKPCTTTSSKAESMLDCVSESNSIDFVLPIHNRHFGGGNFKVTRKHLSSSEFFGVKKGGFNDAKASSNSNENFFLTFNLEKGKDSVTPKFHSGPYEFSLKRKNSSHFFESSAPKAEEEEPKLVSHETPSGIKKRRLVFSQFTRPINQNKVYQHGFHSSKNILTTFNLESPGANDSSKKETKTRVRKNEMGENEQGSSGSMRTTIASQTQIPKISLNGSILSQLKLSNTEKCDPEIIKKMTEFYKRFQAYVLRNKPASISKF